MKNQRMSKIIGVSIIATLLFSAFIGASASTNILIGKIADDINSPPQPLDYTHTVLVEACTASWCPPCATAAAQMHNIYNSETYDFYYVSLVSDKNSYAHQRCGELGVEYIPDYVFDGGFTRHVGSGGLPGAYTSRLGSSGARTVADIDLELDITWNGNAEIEINLDITNNDGTAYNGHLHTYVTEIESRWNTNSGQPYHFAMVGNYAFNQNVNVPVGDSSHYSTIWDGKGYGVGDIEEENIMVIASVFRSGTNFVDETTAVSFTDPPPAELEIEINGGIAGISAAIKNVGDGDLNDINWNIYITGGILKLINVTTEGTLETLATNDKVRVRTNEAIFGFGNIHIFVTVETVPTVAKGFVFGPLILVP